tara:strand:- start:46 stop:282 length:237 start_codon:yes stop_codon:yes gene_type:complete
MNPTTTTTLRKSTLYASDYRRYQVSYKGENIGWVIGKPNSHWVPVYRDCDGSPCIASYEASRADAVMIVTGNAQARGA